MVTEVGAGLRSLTVDGVPFVEDYPDTVGPPMAAGAVLVPWPNRVAGGRWTHGDTEQWLGWTEPNRGHAIHGLTRYLTWRLLDRTRSCLTLSVIVNEQPGWPVALDTRVTYALDDVGLTVTHTVINIGAGAVPFGVGAHPYPRAGHAVTDDCELRLAARTVLDVDEGLIPTGATRPIPESWRTGRGLAAVSVDTAFGDCEPGPDGLVRHQLTGPGHTVDLWADPAFRWVHVYTPDDYPGRGRAVAVEPMTCPPDALNSGTDLIALAPGGRWSGRWGLSPRRVAFGGHRPVADGVHR